MLSSIRKFSTSIFAKILIGIIIVPFIFWGMGGTLRSGNKNIIVIIDKDKYYVQEFINFAQKFISPDQIINDALIDKMFSNFVGEKLIEKEIESFNIKLSDNSLSKLIKHQKDFERENKFSRVEYEKFLIENNITAATFESNLARQEKKKQLFAFLGTGIIPPKFLINMVYNTINQRRTIEIINLNDIFKQEFNFTEEQIKLFFENNKDNFKEIYKSVKFLELDTKKITGNDEFDDLFFRKIDEIDDAISEGKNINYIIEKFSLEKAKSFTFNKFGKDKNSKKIINFTETLLKNVFNIKESETIVLIEDNNKYYILELVKTEYSQKKIDDVVVRKEIILNLEKKIKRKFIAEIISKINKNNFKKYNYDRLAKDKNVPVRKITINNFNDNKILKTEIVHQIYAFPEKRIIVANDIYFNENFLIYIENIENVSINENSNEYEKYSNLSKIKITNSLYDTYDYYIKNKYKVDINYKSLDRVKNYFIY